MTIYDIAKKAGVSASTVSRVVNNKPGISENTRNRIKKIIAECNYIPDASARTLVKKKSKIIGILFEDIRIEHHTDAVYIIEKEMFKHGYVCIASSTGRNIDTKIKYLKIMEQRRVDGIIMIGSSFQLKEIEDAIKTYFCETPVVMINGYLNLPNVSSVIIDDRGGNRDITNLLLGKKLKDISFIIDDDTPANKNKLMGFIDAMKEAGYNDIEDRVENAFSIEKGPEDIMENGRKAVRRIFSKRPETEAIICSTDNSALGCIKELKLMKKSIPEDVIVIGNDNTLLSRIVSPKLSTLDNRVQESSYESAIVLVDMMEKRMKNVKKVLKTKILERESSMV